MTEKQKPTALRVAHNERKRIKPGDVVQLSSGYKARIRPVSNRLILDAQKLHPEPKPPMQFIEEKNREEPNYNHPDYIAALEDANMARLEAVSDIALLFGIELIDPIPPIEEWIGKLKMLERLGHFDLSVYDLEDPDDVEYLFKKHIAVVGDDMSLINLTTGVTEEEIAAAMEGFPGNEERGTDS